MQAESALQTQLDASVRKPTYFQRHWFKYCCVGAGTPRSVDYLFDCNFCFLCVFELGALILIKPIIGSIKSGRLQRSLWHVADLVFANIREHVVEPLQDLVTNLFDTLKHRDPIVTQEELVQDHLALTRMLEEYSAKKQADRNSNLAIIHKKLYGPPESGDETAFAQPTQKSVLDGAQKRSLENKLMTSSHLRSMDVRRSFIFR
jgi:hypothetical protein